MKLFLFALGLMLLERPDPSLLVLDTNLKKPISTTTEFTTSQYLQHCFPVYVAEANALVEAADIAVKRMETVVCHSIDTVETAHTKIILKVDCEVVPKLSITLITEVEEMKIAFGYHLVEKEENKRKAQQKLLDFATYLAR